MYQEIIPAHNSVQLENVSWTNYSRFTAHMVKSVTHSKCSKCFLHSLINMILESSFQIWILKFTMNKNGILLQEKANTDKLDSLCNF